MPAIYHEGSWLGNATDPEVLVKDTVGWTGKNRAYSQTNNAVIAHIENGITYDVSWTGSATVTLKKNSASGATITSGSTSPLSFTADTDYELYFGSSATVTNIMVKDSRITDPTYEPYHESVEEEIEQIYADNGVLGAKNLLKITKNTQTINGVTFTVNRDSDGNVINVTANGTATADATFTLLADYADFEKGDYKVTGCPTGGTATTYEIFTAVRHLDATATEFVQDFGNGASLTVDDNTRNIATSIIVRNNTAVSNIVFKPMITLASDPLSDYEHYVPYVMTNRELTEKAFLIQPIVPSTGDLDNVKTTGIYGIFDPPTHSPESANYCTLLVNRVADNNILQVVFRRNTIYTRAYINGTWYNWFKYAGTELT